MNKKGFTLVEILAVIVILGIIIAIAVPATISTSKKSKNQMYDTKVDMIEKAAKLYGEDNMDPYSADYVIITLDKLVENSYLKKDEKECSLGTNCVIDPRSNEGMDKKKVCICNVNNNVVAELIDANKTDCNGTVCDPSNINVPDLPTSSYRITYDSQGGNACSPNAKTVTKNTAWGELCTPTRTNYNFDGWYTGTNGSGTKITSSTTATGNITVYAKWSASSYTITFDNQGGSGCTNKTVRHGNTWGILCTPTKSGSSFEGWYTGPNGSGTKVTSSTTATGNITVYAKWIQAYTLTYDSQGGSSCYPTVASAGSTWGSLCSPSKSVEQEDCSNVLCDIDDSECLNSACPLKTVWYTFDGWYTSINGSGTKVTSSSVANGNTTVYAKWIRNYELTYKGAGIKNQCTNKSVPSGSPWGTLCEPTYSGTGTRIFDGWYTRSGGKGDRIYSYTTATSDLTIYPKWLCTSYVYTYTASCGSSSCADSNIYKNCSYNDACLGTFIGENDHNGQDYEFNLNWNDYLTIVHTPRKSSGYITSYRCGTRCPDDYLEEVKYTKKDIKKVVYVIRKNKYGCDLESGTSYTVYLFNKNGEIIDSWGDEANTISLLDY